MGGQVANESIMQSGSIVFRSVVLSLRNHGSVVRSSRNKRKRAHDTSDVGSLVNRKIDFCLNNWSRCVGNIMEWVSCDSMTQRRVMNDMLVRGHDFLDSVSVRRENLMVIDMGHLVNNWSTVKGVLVSICDDMGLLIINSRVVLYDDVLVRVRVLHIVLVVVVRLGRRLGHSVSVQLLLISVSEVLRVREGRRFEHSVIVVGDRSNIMLVIVVMI